MTLKYDIPLPYEKIPLEKRPILIDDLTRTLTDEAKRHIDRVFPERLKKGREKANSFYDKIDPLAQKYIRDKYLFHR